MIVFATSDKGGTGRSVTSSNLIYRIALTGADVCYVDFDFGSPTAGAIFGADQLSRGVGGGRGMHAYLQGRTSEPHTVDMWSGSDRASLRNRPSGTGRMMLMPGDEGGGEFSIDEATVQRCLRLFQRLEEEYDVSVVDLSAGRSYATQMALRATADPRLAAAATRWLVFHRWTRQHIVAAHGLVFGERGLLDTGVKVDHDRESLLDRVRFVRTAVINPDSSDLAGLRPPQLAWLAERNNDLQQLAADLRLGRSMLLGSVPIEPIFQWHEQLLTDSDLFGRQVANQKTIDAFEDLAARLRDDRVWERM